MTNSNEITDADVIRFLLAKRQEVGVPGVTFHAYVSTAFPEGCFMVTGGADVSSGYDPSSANAIAQFKSRIKTPEQRAAELREKAARMLADAEALAPTNSSPEDNTAELPGIVEQKGAAA
jgi:hypothetical protein